MTGKGFRCNSLHGGRGEAKAMHFKNGCGSPACPPRLDFRAYSRLVACAQSGYHDLSGPIRFVSHSRTLSTMAMTQREALEVLAESRRQQVVVTTHGSIDLWISLSDTALDFSFVPVSMGQGPLL